ncbi:MAG TPA: cyclopropane-fatty-acyl-phospholipid synthase family protein [Novosphingobium sp.]|nr:cyclopropane-fatty-acyl-phospholipid synthase family protein [Novosphingobium sp.]
MTGEPSTRGSELLAGDAVLRSSLGWAARLWAGSGQRLLDRIDAGLLSGAIHARLPDGTRRVLGGRAPGFEAVVNLNNWRALLRLATGGSIGWYQAWEASEWDSPDPVPLFALFMDNAESLGSAGRASGLGRYIARALHWLNRNTRSGARRNIHAHYDLGNDFYAQWLGGTMAYSSAIFEDSPKPSRWQQRLSPLDYAQLAKITTITNRAGVGAGDRVLEIGCGWGAQAFTLAGTGAEGVAISLSDEQLESCLSRPKGKELRVEFRKQDYRDVDEIFDAIVSVEMVEAVGREYWPHFFDCLSRCLKPGGRAVLQFISIRESIFPSYAASADFIQGYIFPGGMLASEAEFRRLAGERGLAWTDDVDFGLHYAETLRIWRENFEAAVAEGRLPAGFDERFIRLWRYYLMYCEGGFRGGGIDVVQVTLVKR